MGRLEKLIQKLLSRPRDFTYDELKRLLRGLGYQELKLGKTSGSRVAFIHTETNHIIRLHKPHPAKILKSYQIDQIIEEFKRIGVLK